MSKKMLILATVLVLVALFGWWLVLRGQKAGQESQKPPIIAGNPAQPVEVNRPEINDLFVTDVDPDVNHWQTKETEFFTIKFPKEWYWKESKHSENQGYSKVITNNPDFDIDGNAEIGIFSGIGPRSPLELSRDTEIVITDNGSPTSNAGTPQDSLDSIFSLARENNPSVKCEILNNKTIPFTAYCSVAYENNQLQQSYYIVDKQISLTITARTIKNTLIKKDILDKIVKSIVLKSDL